MPDRSQRLSVETSPDHVGLRLSCRIMIGDGNRLTGNLSGQLPHDHANHERADHLDGVAIMIAAEDLLGARGLSDVNGNMPGDAVPRAMPEHHHRAVAGRAWFRHRTRISCGPGGDARDQAGRALLAEGAVQAVEAAFQPVALLDGQQRQHVALGLFHFGHQLSVDSRAL